MTDMLNVFQSLHVSGIINMSGVSNTTLWRSSVADVSLFFLDEHPEVGTHSLDLVHACCLYHWHSILFHFVQPCDADL